jgi:hypothetical protein
MFEEMMRDSGGAGKIKQIREAEENTDGVLQETSVNFSAMKISPSGSPLHFFFWSNHGFTSFCHQKPSK